MKPSDEGTVPAAGVVIEFKPTAFGILENGFLLPSSFQITLDENGEAQVELEPAYESGGWAWRVRERATFGNDYYAYVDESEEPVNFWELLLVDPETLEPPVLQNGLASFRADLDGMQENYISLSNDVLSLNNDVEQLNNTVTDLEEQVDTFPTLEEEYYSVEGGTTGAGAVQPTFSGAPLFAATYVEAGAVIHFRVNVEFTNITSFGSGQYYLTLPFASKYGVQFRDGCLHDISTGINYHISGHTFAGSNIMTLWTTDVQGGKVRDFAFAQGAPITLATADLFHISGQYIKA
jgi:hypothetical protein